MKNDPWVNMNGVQKCMFFSRNVRRKSKNAHILTFFTKPSYRLSILTRGSSQAEFEAQLKLRWAYVDKRLPVYLVRHPSLVL